ncbi:MAG: phosphoenolpyruvate carboxykinase (GTP) [Proteobacteria bacterium]|nr:MAG: phosphoenolpyruvate carboxykinase (GTP) [Pseudomonadota bacterium]MBC6945366.1 phosphoenolpyruvate carboxykinase (GTP) [Gammaproteobacteria bacterium]MCE7895991.1 phosphoenolpyruvate carboxykinase (GTP) [Gammaproteobacteria bacterium PRO8]MDL1880500.1 phosphoenolpyruvate carboxykinase (GTP) [Gammaproteobacteria bacterium PRO2]MCL4775872.1 phosphoenolpyruvate carboxykinase (GTP) [Gammaproteobacteria bacterium]
MTTTNKALQDWVAETAALTKPDHIHWCDGSEAEYRSLVELMLGRGDLLALNDKTYPNCYLHRSDPSDVARVEHLTFVCTPDRDEVGPNNNWMAPAEAHRKMAGLFEGCMRGRTLYVIPYCMGPVDSPYARCGVEITDSPYVVANMKLMTRMGKPALQRIEREGKFVRGLHSTGDLNPERRFIMHFPHELLIQSIGSGYGGNALLGKKCHALRIASWQARSEGWLAEHMLIVEIESPQGERHYLAAAFPSACGKTNLAMLIPPASQAGWKVRTIGDDIAWLHLDAEGRLRAINPESGYFGVVPGTNPKTNRNAFDMITHDTIFTNVAVTADNEPWWEDKDKQEPVTDWRGNPWKKGGAAAAHPNSRFTVAARQNPSYSPLADDPAGVPISAIIFGGRRRELAPLVYQARDWRHGVLIGASVASETTAAATGQVGVVRRDPMAMKPFCGYNFADYWGHWLGFAGKSDRLPQIFHVNWFRQDRNGKFMWPGFGDNLRVLRWIIDRCEGRAGARETPIGFLPQPGDIDLDGLDIDRQVLDSLLAVDAASWREELAGIASYFGEFGDRVPPALLEEHARVSKRLG